MSTITSPDAIQPSEWFKLFASLFNVCLGIILGLFAAEFSRRRNLRDERAAAKDKRIKEFGYFMAGLRAEAGEQRYQAAPGYFSERYAEMRVSIQQEAYLIRGDFDSKLMEYVDQATRFRDSEAGTSEGIKKIQSAFDELVKYTRPPT